MKVVINFGYDLSRANTFSVDIVNNYNIKNCSIEKKRGNVFLTFNSDSPEDVKSALKHLDWDCSLYVEKIEIFKDA